MRYSSLTRFEVALLLVERVFGNPTRQRGKSQYGLFLALRVGLSKKRNFKTRQRGMIQYALSLADASGYQKNATSKRTRRVMKNPG